MTIEVGQELKVFLKGESPWIVVTEVISDTVVKGTINNDLMFPDMHGYQCGDEVTVNWHPVRSWVPVEKQEANNDRSVGEVN